MDIKKIFVLLFLGIFMISLVSSLDFDNVKDEETTTFDNLTSKDNPLLDAYPSIKITNALGLGDVLFEGYISKHTENCGASCSSTMKIKLGTDGSLIDEVIFKTLQEDDSWVEQRIRDYQFYIYTEGEEYEVNDYEYQCVDSKEVSLNGTKIVDCENVLVGHHTENYPVWTRYNLGDEVVAGIYTVKLDANKRADRTVD